MTPVGAEAMAKGPAGALPAALARGTCWKLAKNLRRTGLHVEAR